MVPRYRALAERGQCELSVTPYAHPIIPLLLDFHCARDAVPEHGAAGAPGLSGRGGARAAWHVEEAIRVFTRAFGMRPRGLLARRRGDQRRARSSCSPRRWFPLGASSAAVLRGSLMLTDQRAAEDPLAYNRPYRLGGTGMSCFFRDDALSDLIGFTYATWHGDDAAANLVNELVRSSRAATSRRATTPC